MPQPSRRTSRRQMLQMLGAAGAGLMATACTWAYAYERQPLSVTRARLPVRGLPDALAGLRIGLLSDLHHSAFVSQEQIRTAAETLNAERPDLIVLAGDYVTRYDVRFAEPCAEALAGLRAPHGVFAVMGNHDDGVRVPAALRARGFEVLRDARTRIRIKDAPLDLLGLEFWTRTAPRVARLVGDTSTPLILLAHDPRRLVEAAALNIPLVLSGHTHGGQIVLPVFGAVAAASKFPVVEGMGRRHDTTIFVTRGLGTVILPLRFNCPPEVAVLALRTGRPWQAGRPLIPPHVQSIARWAGSTAWRCQPAVSLPPGAARPHARPAGPRS